MVLEYGVRGVIDVDGWQLDEELEAFVEQVVVDEQTQLPPMFAITLLDPERDVLDRSGLRVGAEVEISTIAQVEHDEKYLVKGEVVAVECEYDPVGARIVVRGYAQSHRLHRGRHTRTFLNVTDSEIVKRVAKEAKIEVGNIKATDKVYEHVAQANLSDWDFISTRARDIGFEVAMVDGKLEFGPPGDSSDAPPETEADPETDPTDPRQLVFGKNLLAFHGRLSAAEQVAEVEVRGWDSSKKERVKGTAQAGTVAAQLELADPSSLAKLFGKQKFISVHRPIATGDEAIEAAKAIADRIGGSFAEADGVARGHPDLRAGVAVNIAGVSEEFSGKYVLSHVRHVIDRDGYQTHFSVGGRQDRSLLGMMSSGASRSGAGVATGTQAVAGLVRGIVDDNVDPQKLGRVKVRLPWLSADFSSAWAPVMQLGAGPGSGTFFLPAVDDEVLVGFEHGEVDRPVVVGGLFNGVDKPPAYDRYLDNGAVLRRAIVSRLGHQIALSDDAKNESGISLVTKNGTVGISLNAKDQKLILSCNGAIEIQAVGEMKLSGSKITIEATGELVLKGKQIKLN